VSQRGKFFAGNFFNDQTVTVALTSQASDRHTSQRKCDLHGISKAKRRIRHNLRLRSIYHRGFAGLLRNSLPIRVGAMMATAITE